MIYVFYTKKQLNFLKKDLASGLQDLVGNAFKAHLGLDRDQ